MAHPKPFLYIKTGCPWCAESEVFLQRNGIAYDKIDIRENPTARAEMERLSGQTKVPTMRWGEDILADFGETELEVFLRAQGAIT